MNMFIDLFYNLIAEGQHISLLELIVLQQGPEFFHRMGVLQILWMVGHEAQEFVELGALATAGLRQNGKIMMCCICLQLVRTAFLVVATLDCLVTFVVLEHIV